MDQGTWQMALIPSSLSERNNGQVKGSIPFGVALGERHLSADGGLRTTLGFDSPLDLPTRHRVCTLL